MGKHILKCDCGREHDIGKVMSAIINKLIASSGTVIDTTAKAKNKSKEVKNE